MSAKQVFGFIEAQAEEFGDLAAGEPPAGALGNEQCFERPARERLAGVPEGLGDRVYDQLVD